MHPSTALKVPSPPCLTLQPKGRSRSRSHRRGLAPAHPRGSTNSPGTARARLGAASLLLSPRTRQWDSAAPHWRSSFYSRVVSGHLLVRPSAQFAKAVANPQMCPLCLRWPWPCPKAVRAQCHTAQLTFLCPGWGQELIWACRAGCHPGTWGQTSWAAAQTEPREVCWQPGLAPGSSVPAGSELSTAVRCLGTQETPGVCRTPCSRQQIPLPHPAVPGQPLQGSPWAALARQLSPGCCNHFLYCAREWLLKPDERERRGQ